eukprot:m.208664 g.208664  ORF g.208664 m.208664 type:complete len:510 (+) comp39712_c2_seq53:45-1574(+)
MSTSSVDLCLVTAVPTEFEAIRAVFEHVTKQPMKEAMYEGPGVQPGAPPRRLSGLTVDWDDYFPDKSRPLKIALLLQDEMGTADASKTVHFISVTELKSAKVVAMAGVCAGAEDKEVHLGDLLMPIKIAKEAGKQKSGGYSADAHFRELDEGMKNVAKMAAAAAGNRYPWKHEIPEDVRNLPSPSLLLDTILAKVMELERKAMSPPMTKGQIIDDIFKDHPEWKSKKLKKRVVASAMDKLMVASSQKIGTTTSGDFKATVKGREYAKNIGDIDGFPPEPENPEIHTDTTLTINVVSEDFDFEQARQQQGQRKIIGAEMEGFAFLDGVKSYLPQSQAIFIKGVSDLATNETKMDYYQHYCAASAAAYLCYMLRSRRFLFERPKEESTAESTANVKKPPSSKCGVDPPQVTSFPDDSQLVSKDADFYAPLKLAVVQSGSSKWERIAMYLKLGDNVSVQIKQDTGDNEVRLGKVFDAWLDSPLIKEPTVEMLLKACEDAGIAERVVKENYKP